MKNLAVRKWISVNAQGETTVLEVDKLRVTHQLGVQLRDLRCVAAFCEMPGKQQARSTLQCGSSLAGAV